MDHSEASFWNSSRDMSPDLHSGASILSTYSAQPTMHLTHHFTQGKHCLDDIECTFLCTCMCAYLQVQAHIKQTATNLLDNYISTSSKAVINLLYRYSACGRCIYACHTCFIYRLYCFTPCECVQYHLWLITQEGEVTEGVRDEGVSREGCETDTF